MCDVVMGDVVVGDVVVVLLLLLLGICLEAMPTKDEQWLTESGASAARDADA